MVPDLDRLAVLQTPEGWAWAPGDRFHQDGTVYACCQRSFVRAQVAAGLSKGISALMAFEVEWMVGQDEDEWTDLNARAFAGHPEQGAWTREDLDLREREPWFDPDGFFLAERGGKLIGFHWTKIHEAQDHETRAHEPIGEVYVVGVAPEARGTGLGRALTLVGLRYLRSRGLFQVMLYVDESNTAAIGLYESLGFTHWDTDVMYRGGGTAG